MKFWDKVEKCNHKNISPNYCVAIYCATPSCRGFEGHCLDCGVYISSCRCGSNNGFSGWSDKRWEKTIIKRGGNYG